LLPADAILLLTETNLDWDAVRERLDGCRLLAAARDGPLTQQLKLHPGLSVLDIDLGLILRWNRRELPCFTLWRNSAAVEDGYVTGLEPGTNFPNFKGFER
jgi:hypothetical protein